MSRLEVKRILRRAAGPTALLALVIATWVIDIYHLGTFPPPDGARLPDQSLPQHALWKSRVEVGINQLVLEGAPYTLGLEEGRLTRELIYREETDLVGQLRQMIPRPFFLRLFELAAMRWFWGIDRYFEPWITDEMYGVAQSASHDFDGLADRFTRQIAYHGLHEVGQLMVDQGGEDMGCTVVALPYRGSWVLGRNFDFEAGRIFDTEKIVKWIFPEHGHAYVSVAWAGMIGAVTAVNDQGLYLSLNAAGSTDFRRQGTPSSLVVLKAIQYANNADEAIRIIRDAKMFITDIFVLLDSREGKLYRIEKSPARTEVIPLTGPSVVTNHLIAPVWRDDPINRYRRDQLTSLPRSERGEVLARAAVTREPPSSRALAESVLTILRDKGTDNGESGGNALRPGNRRAIDALIAAHSVVFDPRGGVLYVSRGPGVSGEFQGFDLARSFSRREPITVPGLPPDPQVSEDLFARVRESARKTADAERAISHGHCETAGRLLKAAGDLYTDSSRYHFVRGELALRCQGDPVTARASWQKALKLVPAYPREESEVRARLKEVEGGPS